MSEETKYNGWTNYETWNLALWIDNEEGSQRYWRDNAREAYEEADKGEERAHKAACALCAVLENETKEGAPEVNGFYGDILSAAISEVNWYEIAEHMIADIKDDIDEEEKEEAEEPAEAE